jgi:hypothetical protein
MCICVVFMHICTFGKFISFDKLLYRLCLYKKFLIIQNLYNSFVYAQLHKFAFIYEDLAIVLRKHSSFNKWRLLLHESCINKPKYIQLEKKLAVDGVFKWPSRERLYEYSLYPLKHDG